MRHRSLAMTLTAVLLLGSAALAPAALAAAPANDLLANATVATVGFSQTIDTTQATTDSDDAQVNASCGAPATDASVWYVITPAADGTIVVDVSGSDYSAGVIVATGTAGNLELLECGPGGTFFNATAGTSYFVLAFDDQTDGAGNGGSLTISISEGPPPPSVAFTVNPSGTVNKAGVATVSGTFSCTDASFLEIDVDASQRVGRASVLGFGFTVIDNACDGASHPWSALVEPQNGKFAGGKTMSASFSFACGAIDCASGYVEQVIQLKGTRK